MLISYQHNNFKNSTVESGNRVGLFITQNINALILLHKTLYYIHPLITVKYCDQTFLDLSGTLIQWT